jgi:methylase of polypeptide subunit release factors
MMNWKTNPILVWMRGLVRDIYLRNFKRGDRLLELNAGTGADAVFLAGRGIEVFATDISRI